MNSNNDSLPVVAIVFAIGFVLFCIVGGMVGCPMYNVYEQEKVGEAELKRADSNRRIAVLEAQAKMDGAKLLAQAEIERAKGVAEANKIIGEGLKGNEDYLRYLWITELHAPDKTIIYVPTEANMPILEASRLPTATVPK